MSTKEVNTSFQNRFAEIVGGMITKLSRHPQIDFKGLHSLIIEYFIH